MDSGVAIQYGDVAPEAKENFVPEASETEFNTLSQLQQYNLNFPNYANPCERYQTVLDGTASAFPSVPESANNGLWSEQISNDAGIFENEIVLTLTANGQYSSQGLTLTFDTCNNIYCNHLNIKWYRDGQLIVDDGASANIDFYPDNAFYFCRNQVQNYDQVVITFYSINMPKNRLKLRAIDYGYGTYFYGNELRNVKLIQEIDPISSEISINTCDFTLDSKTDMEYSFQAKQPLSVYFNGELKATTFVKTSKRKSKQLWTVESEDYIGLLDSIPFPGGIYIAKNAVELLEEIFAIAKVPYNISDVFSSATVTGHIPYTTCREAIMHVAIAIGAVVDTSNSDKVEIYTLSDEETQIIPLKRIMQGQSFDDDETTTGVEVAAHTYTPLTENTYLYKAEDSGTGENIFVKFSEPMHDIDIYDGEILQSGANYAVINANSECQLWGQKYEHTTSVKRKDNPKVLKSEIEKVVAIENATLVSTANIDAVLERCFKWLLKNNQTNLKIIEGKHVSGGEVIKYGQVKYGAFKYGAKLPKVVTYDKAVNVGEVITCETEYLGNKTGRIIKETFNLNGGIIIKEAILK